MTIGLVLLAIVAIMIFFGVSEKFFRRMGVPNWLAFLLVLALIVGAVVPSIKIGNFAMNVGGFIIPLIIMVVLDVVIGWTPELFRTMIATLAVAALALGVRVLIMPTTTGMMLVSSLIVGFVGGAVAYLIGGTRLSTLSGVMGGIVLGDVAVNFVYVFGIGDMTYSLGSRGVFDSIIIAAVFGVMILEFVGFARRSNENKRINKTALNTESAEEFYKEEYSDSFVIDEPNQFDDYFDDTIK